jgi:AcrR family transcriptional regulator
MRTSARPTYVTARQAALFDHLTALFLAEGFTQFTVEDLAKRLRCSKSTLYTLADSREQLIRATIVYFFRRATELVDTRVAAVTGMSERILAYLSAVGEALEPASERFMNDLAAFAPAREVYEKNTAIAARRVRALINEGAIQGVFREVHADFVADVAATMMVRIQQRAVAAATGLDDANAYRELAALITAGVSAGR